LLAHEDKVYPGALVASMSIPWGETKGDADLGGYHLVWTRDMVKSASALLATGQTATPLRSLIWLACIQRPDGAVPQNSWINGDAYWQGKQLDEVAAPILLAWRLREQRSEVRSQKSEIGGSSGAEGEKAENPGLGLFDPWTLVVRAARYLICHGPITGQERWEENSGYSPSTLAAIIAALVCAAEFARLRNNGAGVAPAFILDYADWLSAHIEEWTVTRRGELAPGNPRHYVRINPADPEHPENYSSPDEAMIQIANGGGLHPARNVVSTDFLELVRLGVRAADDPSIVDSIAVIDSVLKYDLPQGPGWRRYNHDGYGQKDDGGAFDGAGTGRCWPLLTAERGLYELAAGRDVAAYIKAMESFANEGGMLPEQVWDADNLPEAHMKRGEPTGSAMPLCWAHAEYLTLVRSRKDGVPCDRIEPVYKRYVKDKQGSDIEIWLLAYQPPRIRPGKALRLVSGTAGTVRWSVDAWKTTNERELVETGLECWYADLPVGSLPAGTQIVFTFRRGDKWEGRDFNVQIS
jgi:glucoamylase